MKTQPSCADPVDTEALSVDDARDKILQAVTPLTRSEKVAIRDSLGRVLAEPVSSPLNVPSHTNSAMDGIALHHSALPENGEEKILNCMGQALAGHAFKDAVGDNQCVQIMTGAPMPAGTDTVIMQEQIEINGDSIRIGDGHRNGQNVRQAGEDLSIGMEIYSPGKTITPADLGVLASMGIGELAVRRRPKVAFFSTGDELKSIGETLEEGEVYDSNRYSLFGMLKKSGVEVVDLGVIRDDPESLKAGFAHASHEADIVITTGGVSVGEADFIKPILEEMGQPSFWKIAMKPGRPLTFGNLNDSLFFGLPGNPVAVMVTFYQFVFPALHYLMTGQQHQPFLLQARSSTALRKKPGRTEFTRGYYTIDEAGKLEVDVISRQGSGILTSMSRGNCFVILPESQGDVAVGDSVTVQPFLDFGA